MIGVMMLKTGESEYMYFFLVIAGSKIVTSWLPMQLRIVC